LDVGCGDGALASVIRRQLNLSVAGVDTNQKGVELAKATFAEHGLAGQFKVISTYDTGFPDDSFSAAVCSEVIEHVDDPRAMLREVIRVLVPGGRLILTTPIRLSEHPFDPMHVQEWFVGDFVALCREVFGEPLKILRSHPIVWYEFVSSSNRWISRGARIASNTLTRLGHNPFEECSGVWRCYTTQTLVLAKPIDSPSGPR
jgi:SAM-dependent methyltransferase